MMKQIMNFANGKGSAVDFFFFLQETECTWSNILAEVAC